MSKPTPDDLVNQLQEFLKSSLTKNQIFDLTNLLDKWSYTKTKKSKVKDNCVFSEAFYASSKDSSLGPAYGMGVGLKKEWICPIENCTQHDPICKRSME